MALALVCIGGLSCGRGAAADRLPALVGAETLHAEGVTGRGVTIAAVDAVRAPGPETLLAGDGRQRLLAVHDTLSQSDRSAGSGAASPGFGDGHLRADAVEPARRRGALPGCCSRCGPRPDPCRRRRWHGPPGRRRTRHRLGGGQPRPLRDPGALPAAGRSGPGAPRGRAAQPGGTGRLAGRGSWSSWRRATAARSRRRSRRRETCRKSSLSAHSRCRRRVGGCLSTRRAGRHSLASSNPRSLRRASLVEARPETTAARLAGAEMIGRPAGGTPLLGGRGQRGRRAVARSEPLADAGRGEGAAVGGRPARPWRLAARSCRSSGREPAWSTRRAPSAVRRRMMLAPMGWCGGLHLVRQCGSADPLVGHAAARGDDLVRWCSYGNHLVRVRQPRSRSGPSDSPPGPSRHVARVDAVPRGCPKPGLWRASLIR